MGANGSSGREYQWIKMRGLMKSVNEPKIIGRYQRGENQGVTDGNKADERTLKEKFICYITQP